MCVVYFTKYSHEQYSYVYVTSMHNPGPATSSHRVALACQMHGHGAWPACNPTVSHAVSARPPRQPRGPGQRAEHYSGNARRAACFVPHHRPHAASVAAAASHCTHTPNAASNDAQQSCTQEHQLLPSQEPASCAPCRNCTNPSRAPRPEPHRGPAAAPRGQRAAPAPPAPDAPTSVPCTPRHAAICHPRSVSLPDTLARSAAPSARRCCKRHAARAPDRNCPEPQPVMTRATPSAPRQLTPSLPATRRGRGYLSPGRSGRRAATSSRR